MEKNVIAKFTADVISPASSPNLKAIAILATGTDHVDLEAARARGISVFNTPHANSEVVGVVLVAAAAGLSTAGVVLFATTAVSTLSSPESESRREPLSMDSARCRSGASSRAKLRCRSSELLGDLSISISSWEASEDPSRANVGD